MLLIGSRHRRDSCSEAFRFARSSSSRPIRRSTSTFRTPLLGFIDRPSVDTTVTAATPRLGRRPDFGSGLPRPEHVPLLPFLPASAVSAAASRSEDPLVRRSAGLLHPAADHGVRQVSELPGSASQPSRRPEGRGPEGPGKSSPVAKTLRSVPLLGSLDHAVTAPRPFGRGRVHRLGVPSRRSSGTRLRVATPRCTAFDLRALLHRGVRCVRATLPSYDRSMLPWALDRPVSRRCRASRRPARAGRFAWRPEPLRRPRTRTWGKAGCFGPVWLHATDGGFSPKGGPRRSRWLRRLPKEQPRPHSTVALGTDGVPVDPPRGEVHRVGPTPEGVRLPTSSRRISEETRSRPSARSEERRPVVRAPSLRPSAVARVHDGETARRGRSRPEAWPSARHSRAPSRDAASNPAPSSRRTPAMGEPEAPPGGGPLAARDSGVSSKLESRLRARQSSCSPGWPRLDPKTKPLPRSEDRIDRRRSAVGAVGPHIPPWVVIRHEHRSARAEMDRDPSRASPTGVGSASVPSAPKRFRNPDRCDPDGQ
jgi:hypothetical protein